MPAKNPDVWAIIFAWLLSVKEQGIAATLAGVMAWLRGRYEGEGKLKSLLDSLMCSIFGWFVKDGLTLIGLNADWAYLSSVVIGFLGTKYFGKRLRYIADKKTGAIK
ncbi:phage holin, lambda family [Serratia aquatilis]|uniref:Phage holin, lambda family n=1 Tax=Serratia aquatilis TaxID=1737515 RepID=A0ABV6EEM2_9GAMM